MEPLTIIMTLAAGFACGYINTLAGSGSAVSLTLLNTLGLPSDIALATNRVAIIMQGVVGVGNFHRKGLLDKKRSPLLIAPAALGAIIGATIVVNIKTRALDFIIAGVMLVVLGLLIFKPQKFLNTETRKLNSKPGMFEMAGYFLIGIYGGMIQVAVGVFLLMQLVLVSGYDLVRANAVKIAIVLCYTIPAMTVFIYKGLVRWDIGLILGAGNMIGAFIASNTAAKRGAKFVRWLLIIVVCYAAARFFWQGFTG